MSSINYTKAFDQILFKLKSQHLKLKELENEILLQFDFLFHDTRVPILKKDNDVPYQKVDFKKVFETSQKNLPIIEKLLQEILTRAVQSRDYLSHHAIQTIVSNCIILAAQYSNSERDWSCSTVSHSASRILTMLVSKKNHGTGLEILMSSSNSIEIKDLLKIADDAEVTNYKFGIILKPLLLFLSKHLNKEIWKNDPGAQEFLLWLLYNLSQDDLSDQLGYLMPGILLLLDDWEPHNKITALEALVYIINNVAGSELRCTGRAAVIYEAAKHHLYSRDPELLQAAYPTAVAAAVVLQQDPSIAHSAQLSAVEEVLSMLLRDMAFEQRLDLRSVYVTNLPAALTAAGIRSVRWQDQVVQVLCNYLTTFEGASARDRLCALKALQVYSSECWPQAGRQRDEILKALLQLVYISTAEGPLQLQPKVLEEVLDECRQCVQQLLLCQPPPEPNLLTGLDCLALPAALQQNVHRVFEIPIKEQIVK